MPAALYEIVNMSDHYTMRCDDFAVAVIACLMLGGGQYGLVPLDPDEDHGGQRMPLFTEIEWVRQIIGQDDLNAFTIEHRLAIAECMDSVVIGDRAEYEKFIATFLDPKKLEAFKADWHDRRRTSMNDIGGRATQWAARLRDDAAAPPDRPLRQIFRS